MAELTSKERRLAKRAAAREAAGAKQPSDATTKPPAAAVRRRPHGEGAAQAQARRRARRGGAGADKDDVGLRRRGRRRHVKAARGEAPAAAAGGGAKSSKKRPREPSSAPLVAFVGQLGFSVTAERLKAFFTSQDVPGTLKVRLLTDAKTGKSRGMAFVQCETAEALYACVALHHAQIDGRRINVEETVDRVLEEFVASGQLRRDEVDDGVRRLLQRRSGRVAHAALTEYASLVGRDKFENPAAYLTKIICRVSQEENPFEKYSHEPREAEIVVPKPFRGDEPDEPAACPATTRTRRRQRRRQRGQARGAQAPAPELLSLNRDDARADEAQLTAKERRRGSGHGAQGGGAGRRRRPRRRRPRRRRPRRRRTRRRRRTNRSSRPGARALKRGHGAQGGGAGEAPGARAAAPAVAAPPPQRSAPYQRPSGSSALA
ncbi:hypothetical protein JL722_13092 [Aureococcus anophagefferens]|nr:hypothetical protein JL722_13092 [Aureococcus anophagefferens]